MKIAERIVMVILLLVLIGGGAWIYFAVQYKQEEVRVAVANGEYEIPLVEEEELVLNNEEWRTIYPVTVPIVIGSTTVEASVADSLPERIKGLSDTAFLPENVVKLFAFGAEGEHSIWMKDMNYALDIFWIAKNGEIVHIEEAVSPDSYPKSFSSPTPAWYVIEAAAGFTEMNKIKLGDKVVIPN
jgi:uncharacterized membrane protein (UPF0127 family)